jgi:hypothetical protein
VQSGFYRKLLLTVYQVRGPDATEYGGKDKMTPILKLNDHDEELEIEFELSWLLSLSLQERFQLMLKKTRELIDLLEKNGHGRPAQIIKRT